MAKTKPWIILSEYDINWGDNLNVWSQFVQYRVHAEVAIEEAMKIILLLNIHVLRRELANVMLQSFIWSDCCLTHDLPRTQ